MKKAPRFFFVAMLVIVSAILVWSGLVAARGVILRPPTQPAQGAVIIHDIITDTDDARIVGASLRFSRDGVTLNTNTNREGSYEVKLEVGSYDVQVNANGFQRIYNKQFEVRPGPAIELDFKMVVGALIDPITLDSDLPEPTSPPTATELSGQSPATKQKVPYPPQYATVKTVQAWIPMKDGVRLAVNLYMPDGPLPATQPGEKFPAILEYLPYRKDDWTLARDWDLHSYFVRRGFVTARVDIRGTGASEGAPPDREYSDQEQQDGLEVIAWLAKQPWSNGNVGMMGISWGGFNSIQLARLHPPALKAIIAMCATEELFHDDIHYIDNLMHLDEFELGMDLQLGLTRAPDFPTDEKSLAARFDAKPWAPLYLQHQRDSEFWRRASVAPESLR